jgi:hypothetical protein
MIHGKEIADFALSLPSDRNLTHLYNLLKLQIVVLYLDWQLARSPMTDPEEET